MLQLNFNPFPQIKTERLVLRRTLGADLNQLFLIRSNPQIMNAIDKEPAETLQDAKLLLDKMDTLINECGGIIWAICLKEDNIQIGNISFHVISKEHHRAELGYVLLPHFHRRGIMKEAIVALLDFGFNTLKFHSVEAKINPINIASKSILEKNGFIKEAHFKENFYFRNKYSDTAIYSLLNPNKDIL
jgi:ribosomal-protein-alanine N-acetyltransferase